MTDQREFDENGVKITIINIEDELEGWDKFRASAENTNAEQKTLNGNIYMFDAEGEHRGNALYTLRSLPERPRAMCLQSR